MRLARVSANKSFVAVLGLFLAWTSNGGGGMAKECETTKSATTATTDDCTDRQQNLVEGHSDINKGLPITIKHLRTTVYNYNFTPTCYDRRPTVLLPGFTHFWDGEMTVPPNNFNLPKSGNVKMTIRNPNFDKPICLDGLSQYQALPHSLCSFDLCTFIGKNLCLLLQRPGTHTIDEMVQKGGWNATVVMPDAPRIFGISFVDFFAGEFNFEFLLETEGKLIAHLQVPTNLPFVPIGMQNEVDEDKTEC